MPNPLNVPITPPRVAFIDPRSGAVSREWYMFFLSLFQLSGGSTVSLDDVQKGPPMLTVDEINVIVDKASENLRPSTESTVEQIAELRRHMNVPPLVLSPFDAELFGHWWFEGPEWLNAFLRKAAYDQTEFQLTTPSRYLAEHPTHQMLAPAASSWGHKGYWEVWLEESNAWVYPHLHAAARRMVELARKHLATDSPLVERVLSQAARELLLAQSSDWAFLMKTGTARTYATKRTEEHLHRFTRLYEQFCTNAVDEAFLANCEFRDNIFEKINWRYYA